MSSIISTTIVAVVGTVVGVPQAIGAVHTAQDSAAQNDIANVTLAESAALALEGRVFGSIAELNSSSAGVVVTPSHGVHITLTTSPDGQHYMVAVESQSGRYFARIDGGEIGSGDSLEEAISGAGPLPSGLRLPHE